MVKKVKAWKLEEQCEKTNISTFKTSREPRSRIWQATPNHSSKKPDIIIVHCGTNDLNNTGKTEVLIASDIVALAKSIGSDRIDVCVLGLITRGGILESKKYRRPSSEG